MAHGPWVFHHSVDVNQSVINITSDEKEYEITFTIKDDNVTEDTMNVTITLVPPNGTNGTIVVEEKITVQIKDDDGMLMYSTCECLILVMSSMYMFVEGILRACVCVCVVCVCVCV